MNKGYSSATWMPNAAFSKKLVFLVLFNNRAILIE